MQVKRAFTRFMIFALGGLLGEVFFTAAGRAFHGDWNLHGHTSPWMMIDYGLFGVILMPVANLLIRKGVPLPVRAFFYMLVIYAVEYTSGIIFTWGLGLRIWDYSYLPYNLHGQITLYTAPVWYALGFLAEYLYRKVDAIAVLLLRGVTAEQIEQLSD